MAISEVYLGDAVEEDVTKVYKGSTLEFERESSSWPASLVAKCVRFYKFDELSGAVIDSTGNQNATNNGATPGIAGVNGNAYRFANNDDVQTGYVGTYQFTHAAWVKIEVDVSGAVISKYDGSLDISQMFYDTNSKRFTIDIGHVGGNRTSVHTGLNSVVVGTWYHVAATYDGTTLRIYLDGVLKNSSTVTVDNFIDAVPYTIGSRSGAGFISALIDDLGIFDEALTLDEINTVKDYTYPE